MSIHTGGELIGYWPLIENGEDASKYGRHGKAENIKFNESAVFDGRQSFIELPALQETDGSRPFSLSLEFKTNDADGFLPGGLVSRYSMDTMSGWHLSVLTQAGVTSTQSNWRNLQFGWSNRTPKHTWKDWGSPGNGRLVCTLCVYNGSLYAGIFDDEKDRLGHVYRLDQEEGEWMECGHPDQSNSVWSLVEWKGRLYAGTMRYKAAGSLLPESPNQEPGGKIYRYEGGQEWSFFAELPVPDSDSVGSLTVYQERLIAMSFYPHGVFAYDEEGACQALGAPGPDLRTMTVSVHQGYLYIGCNQSGGVYRRTLNTPWEYCGTAPKVDQVYCFSTFHNELLMGVWHEGRMLRYEGGTEWSDYGLMGSEMEVMGISVLNGKLYGGTLPSGQVYGFKGDRQWELLAELEPPHPDIKYRRVWSMAVFNGGLYAGTLPSGKVWSLYNDPLATFDHSLSDGWHQAVISYDCKKLSLYLDDELVSSVDVSNECDFIPNTVPMVIGSGPQSVFSGQIRNVRLFDAALEGEQFSSKGAGGK